MQIYSLIYGGESMKTIFYLSALLGASFGLVCGIVLLFIDKSLVWLGTAAGVLFGVLMFFCLIINDRIVQNRYRKIEKQFTKEVIYRENTNFIIQGKSKNGNLYLFSDMMQIECQDGKPYLSQSIPYSDIRSVETKKEWELILHTDHFDCTVTAVDAESLREKIHQIMAECD